MEDIIKQVLVLRKDLSMRKGKMISQGAHSSGKVFFDCEPFFQDITCDADGTVWYQMVISVTEEMKDWVQGDFTKIALGVNNEENLLALYEAARAAHIPCSLITDNGKTEFNGVKTNTSIAIGPAKSSKIDAITGPDTELYKKGFLTLL